MQPRQRHDIQLLQGEMHGSAFVDLAKAQRPFDAKHMSHTSVTFPAGTKQMQPYQLFTGNSKSEGTAWYECER